MSILSWTPTRHAALQVCSEQRVEFDLHRYGVDALGNDTGHVWGIDRRPVHRDVGEALWDLESHCLTHEGDSQQITEAGQAQLELWDVEHGATGQESSAGSTSCSTCCEHL